MSIILLEGPDGAGKTTLAQTSFKDYQYLHHGAYETPQAAFIAYDELLSSILQNTVRGICHNNIVIDRLHISERIYGTYFHGKRMEDWRYSYIDNLCLTAGIQVVICLPPWDVVEQNWENNRQNEMIQDLCKLKEIYIVYKDIVDKASHNFYTRMPVSVYDYTEEEGEI